jgi:peptidoglycan/LPS O-acetylase OafA/YrhL
MAALAVVFFHYTYLNETVRVGMPALAALTNYGYLGVHLFFMISGFVIFMTLGRISDAKDFFIARASRLYPAFLVSIVFTLVALYALQGHSMFSIKDIALNLTMFPGTLGAVKINPAYWTLSYEIIFYGIVFLAILLRGKSGVMPIVTGWAALSAINIYFDLGLIEKLLILKSASLFAGGAYLYFASSKTRHWKAYLALFILTLPISTHYAAEQYYEQIEQFSFWKANNIAVVSIITGFYALLAFIAFRPNAMSWMPQRFVELCGGGSYILYLIHERVGSLMVERLYPSLGAMAIVLVIALMSAAAALIYVYFDKPVQKKLRSLRIRKTPTPSAADLNPSN